MSFRISLLCPTRRRRDNVMRLVSSAASTASGPVEFVFYQDDDALGSVPEALADSGGVKVVTGPRRVFSDMWNHCWTRASADVAMMCSDDVVFQTPGWDAAVLAAFEQFPDRIVLVHGDDGIHGPGLATHPFLSRQWVEAVGYFAPDFFKADWLDTWVTELADRIDRRVYLASVLTEHMHPNVGKAPWDTTYADKQAHLGNTSLWAATTAARAQDADKLRAAIERSSACAT